MITDGPGTGDGGTVVVEAPAPPVERSPSDLLRLVVATVLLGVLLVVQALFGDTLVTFAAQLLEGLGALPHWIVQAVVVVTRVLAIVVLGGGLAFTLWHGRLRLLVTAFAAALVALGLAVLLDTFAPGSGRSVVDVDNGLVGPLTAAGFPSASGVAVVAAILTAAAPWLSRRWRRIGWVLVIGVTLTRFLSSPVSFDSFRNALVGWVAGAGVLVLLGGPRRRPSGRSLAEGLAAVGVPLARLEQASVDARGSTPYFATGADGRRLFVKALGEDQRSADLLFRVYRWVNRRDLGDERPFSSLRRGVEHEALVALAARDVGVRTPRLVAFATAEPNAFVLAYEAIEGRSLDRLEPDEVTDGVLAAIWEQVGRLREHRIAHRDLRLANVFLASDGAVWLIDFGFSELAASSLLLTTDVAELLASSTLQVGPERAVAVARQAVGPEALRDALDRLHPWALSGATRSGSKARPGLLDDLRRQVGAATGAGEAAPASEPDRVT
ncbi:MAG TPA: lipopolysaccharide kinase InaA family protein [Acidimicrobiales bacterium]|nr:lipopolysaccharide kinase InaA family protein [Acidimicrobiales bacterium]